MCRVQGHSQGIVLRRRQECAVLPVGGIGNPLAPQSMPTQMRIGLERVRKRARRFNVRAAKRLTSVERQLPAVRLGESRSMHLDSVSYVASRSFRRFPDLMEGNFWRAVGAEKSVGFLKGIGELGITKTTEESRAGHHIQELAITSRKLLRILYNRITPGRFYSWRAALVIRNPAKLGQDNGLATMGIAVESQNPPGWTATIEQLLNRNLRSVTQAKVLDIGVVIVNADHVGGATLPSIVADHRTSGVKCLSQMVQSFNRMPLLRGRRQIRHAP